jgi:hypothetical protein
MSACPFAVKIMLAIDEHCFLLERALVIFHVVFVPSRFARFSMSSISIDNQHLFPSYRYRMVAFIYAQTVTRR